MNKACDYYRALIEQSALEGLSEAQKIALESHLNYCGPCRRYRETIRSIRREMQQPPHPSLSPDPEIKSNLKRILKSGEKQPKAPSCFIIKLLNRPMPIYQALIMASLAVFAFYIFNTGLSTIASDEVRRERQTNRPVVSQIKLPQVLASGKNVHMDKAAVGMGISAAEDSTFSDLVFITM